MNSPLPLAGLQGPLAKLDARSREIFREIVEAYLDTGEPVGSRTLSKAKRISLSPASIRNIMADLAQLGLLDSPHAMAGRRPTQAGLRLFVDGLLEIGGLAENDRRDIDAAISRAGRNRDDVMAAASNMLSGLAGGAGLVAAPAREAAIKHVELVPVAPGQALTIIVFEDGEVENRLTSIPPGAPPSALVEATNYFNTRFKGKTLAEARQDAQDALTRDRAALDAAAATLVQGGLAEWSGGDTASTRALIVRGRANLLSDPETAADLERVRQLFDALERSEELIQLLDMARQGESVRIFIGSENPLFSLSGSSTIVAPYHTADRRVVGALGVIGPTRLNYARVIPVVDYTAQVVGRLLDGRG
jgi:heat-inducible transcriptional repressor